MSLRAYELAWQSAVTGTEKLVLLAIADYAGDDCIAWPSQQRLAEKTGFSCRTVRRIVAELIAEGHLVELAEGRGARCSKRVQLIGLTDSGMGAKAVTGGRFCADENRPAATGLADEKRSAATGLPDENRPPVATKAANCDQKSGHRWPMNRNEPLGTKQQRAPDCEPASAADAAAQAQLEAVGFTSALAADLAAKHGAARVADVVRWVGAMQRAGRLRSSPAAWVRRALEEGFEEPAEARAAGAAAQGRHADDARRVQERREAERRRRENDEARARAARTLARFDALPAAEQAQALELTRRRLFSQPESIPTDWREQVPWRRWLEVVLNEGADERGETQSPPLLRLAR